MGAEDQMVKIQTSDSAAPEVDDWDLETKRRIIGDFFRNSNPQSRIRNICGSSICIRGNKNWFPVTVLNGQVGDKKQY